jgi:hypothetical protein
MSCRAYLLPDAKAWSLLNSPFRSSWQTASWNSSNRLKFPNPRLRCKKCMCVRRLTVSWLMDFWNFQSLLGSSVSMQATTSGIWVFWQTCPHRLLVPSKTKPAYLRVLFCSTRMMASLRSFSTLDLAWWSFARPWCINNMLS